MAITEEDFEEENFDRKFPSLKSSFDYINHFNKQFVCLVLDKQNESEKTSFVPEEIF